jgi:hypothetical protein
MGSVGNKNFFKQENKTMSDQTSLETVPVVEAVVEKPKRNKSKLILGAFKQSPAKLATPANDIIDAIRADSGVEVTVSLVNNMRSRLKAKKKARSENIRKGIRVKKSVKTELTVPSVEEQEKLLIVKDAAVKLGGLDALKEYTAKLESLTALLSVLAA